ncbi:UNVERIFIED_CONTAM: hypothetical protein FKN15_011058 [Acipenser sinensis]
MENTGSPSTPRVRLKNTVRLELADDEELRVKVDLKFLVEKILMGELGIYPQQIFCLQEFLKTRIYDITLASEALCYQIWEIYKKKRNLPCFFGIKMEMLYTREATVAGPPPTEEQEAEEQPETVEKGAEENETSMQDQESGEGPSKSLKEVSKEEYVKLMGLDVSDITDSEGESLAESSSVKRWGEDEHEMEEAIKNSEGMEWMEARKKRKASGEEKEEEPKEKKGLKGVVTTISTHNRFDPLVSSMKELQEGEDYSECDASTSREEGYLSPGGVETFAHTTGMLLGAEGNKEQCEETEVIREDQEKEPENEQQDGGEPRCGPADVSEAQEENVVVDKVISRGSGVQSELSRVPGQEEARQTVQEAEREEIEASREMLEEKVELNQETSKEEGWMDVDKKSGKRKKDSGNEREAAEQKLAKGKKAKEGEGIEHGNRSSGASWGEEVKSQAREGIAAEGSQLLGQSGPIEEGKWSVEKRRTTKRKSKELEESENKIYLVDTANSYEVLEEEEASVVEPSEAGSSPLLPELTPSEEEDDSSSMDSQTIPCGQEVAVSDVESQNSIDFLEQDEVAKVAVVMGMEEKP